MKNENTKTHRKPDSEMRREYDFTGGVRGKHHKAMEAGYTITVHKADGTTVSKQMKSTSSNISDSCHF